MSKKTDVLVVGSGMAGLVAALAAVKQGCNVSVASEGMGALAISNGCIDLLGYDGNGNRLDDPWAGMDSLAANHPYQLVGKEEIKTALTEVCASLASQGLPMHSAKDEGGRECNMLVPTIMGTLRPTWLFQADLDWENIRKAKSVLVLGVKGFRDFRPRLIINQLLKYPEWENKEFGSVVLPEPFKEGHRSLNALDLAYVGDRVQGKAWLLDALKNKGKDYDLALIPPIMGTKANSPLRKLVPEALGCKCVELQTIPPGVAGLRIRNALVDELVNAGVEFYENAQISDPVVKDGQCESLTVNSSGKKFIHTPKSVVVATGGILSGGIILGEGTAKEAIFDINLPVPENVDDWTNRDIFAEQMFAKLGVCANSSLQAIDDKNEVILKNVFFAGRTLGGYDFTREKSGQGVAIASGWKAGCMAAQTAKTSTASGADI